MLEREPYQHTHQEYFSLAAKTTAFAAEMPSGQLSTGGQTEHSPALTRSSGRFFVTAGRKAGGRR